jgi:glutathione synthase/RimK-type ligase-like ATP-grasp enzyme
MAAVHEALQRLGLPVAFFDQRQILATAVELCVDSVIRGTLQIPDQTIDLNAITAVYLRPYDWRRLPEIDKSGPRSPAWRHACAVEEVLASWVELTPALVVNRLTAMAATNSKPDQAAYIRNSGFAVPETLITTDPTAAQDFWDKYGTVIYKSISGERSIVSRLTPQHVRRLRDLAWCPTQFQRYIPGRDVRVHVVGDDVFACEVASDADDYRYATRQGARVDIRVYDLPQETADRCRALAAAMDLLVSGIDLRRTPDGQWYCFEVNPSPAFSYYQAATHQPIDAAIARLLGESSRLAL